MANIETEQLPQYGSAVLIDTMSYNERLQAKGYTKEQAEEQIKVLLEIINAHLITKQDFTQFEHNVELRLKDLEHRLTIRVGSMIAVAIAIIAALGKIL